LAIYQRGENWYIDFTFKRQRIRESIGPSRKGPEKVIAKKKTEIVENKYLDIRKEPEPVIFYDFAKEYLQWAKANKKESTYTKDIFVMRDLEREFHGKNIQEITTWEIEKWKMKRRKTCKHGSVNRELALLKHFFSMAVKWRKMKENPARDVRAFKGEVRRVRFLLPNEVQILISNCEDWLKPIVTVAVHTGMRNGELLGLRRPQVNLEQGIISLIDTKNHESREISMDETVKAILRSVEVRGDLVFVNESGKQYLSPYLHRAFHEALDKSGITNFRWHDLRHTFASNLVMNGADLNDVRDLLGHKKIDMTFRYAHLSPKHKKGVVNILDRAMSQIPPQAEKVVQLMP
jgi:site-specific recombinase XerD